MKDEDRALLDGEPPEAPLELVAIVDGSGTRRARHGLDARRAGCLPSIAGDAWPRRAGVGQDPVQPGLEAPGVPQGAEARQAVINAAWTASSAGRVAQDSKRDRHASVTGHASAFVEGLSIASLRLAHQVRVHPSLQGR